MPNNSFGPTHLLVHSFTTDFGGHKVHVFVRVFNNMSHTRHLIVEQNTLKPQNISISFSYVRVFIVGLGSILSHLMQLRV